MSRDDILVQLLSLGAISVIHAIQDVEAGRHRRVTLPRFRGDPALMREVIGLLQCMGAEVDLVARSSDAVRFEKRSRVPERMSR
jgi:hypothetical protein